MIREIVADTPHPATIPLEVAGSARHSPVSIAELAGIVFGLDSAVIILAKTTVRRAAWARWPRPALLAAAVQRPRLTHLSVSPPPGSDPGMAEAAPHLGAASAPLVEDDGESW